MNDHPAPESGSEAFDEQSAESYGESQSYSLRLFVSGMTPNSMRALATIRRVCEEHLQGRYELEVVDIYQSPQLARDEQIVAAPTLIKSLPQPLRRLIGDLSDIDRVLHGLDLSPRP